MYRKFSQLMLKERLGITKENLHLNPLETKGSNKRGSMSLKPKTNLTTDFLVEVVVFLVTAVS